MMMTAILSGPRFRLFQEVAIIRIVRFKSRVTAGAFKLTAARLPVRWHAGGAGLSAAP